MNIRVRRLVGVMILLLSMALLLWGLWPLVLETRSLILPAGSLQLPTPISWGLGLVLGA